MKKNLLKSAFCLFAGLMSVGLSAQTYLADDFEGAAKNWTAKGGVTFSILGNPERQALNPSQKALLVERGVSDPATVGVSLVFDTPLKNYAYVHVKVFRNNQVLPVLQVSTTTPVDIQPLAVTLIDSVWMDVVYDIATYSSNIECVTFIADPTASITVTSALWIDDVLLNNDPTPRVATIGANAKIDQHAYPAKGAAQQYSLLNNWIYSVKEDNYVANRVGTSGFVRGMAALNGKMYFPDRENRKLLVVDAATGTRDADIQLAANVFTYTGKGSQGQDSVYQTSGLILNDIKIDNANNVLVANCLTASAGVFQVWKIDLATGNGVLIVEDSTLDVKYPTATIRFDAFGVYGDVNQTARIMAANASALEAYYWDITNGQVTGDGLIEYDNFWNPITADVNPGSAPQIFPLEGGYFYIDGNATFPTLYDQDGNLADGFFNNPSLLNDSIISPTDTAVVIMNQGHNGVCEFEMNGEYYVLMAGRNTVVTAGRASFFSLFKYADASKAFATMTRLWNFPDAGMGGASNAYRTAVPSVSVLGNQAKLYLYTGENGYATYTFTDATGAEAPIVTSVKQVINDNNGIDLLVNANQVKLSEMANVEVYSLTGQKVFQAANVSMIEIAQKGIYIVKTINAQGLASSHKVVIK